MAAPVLALARPVAQVPPGARIPPPVPGDPPRLSPRRREGKSFLKAGASHDIYSGFIIKKYRIQMGR